MNWQGKHLYLQITKSYSNEFRLGLFFYCNSLNSKVKYEIINI